MDNSINTNTVDYIPISYLNQLEYCERRFWLMYVCGEMEVNAPVLEGIYQHERAHEGSTRIEGDTIVHRRLYLWSDRLRVSGFADLVEEKEDGELVPVEYKRGRMGEWLNDHVQLCVQAMCLEERGEREDSEITRGEIFYHRSRRRVQVEITPELRRRAEATVERAFELLAAGKMPPPIDNRKKCKDCSLENICMPREVLKLRGEGRR